MLKNAKLQVRKLIALSAMGALVALVFWYSYLKVDIPPNINTIVMAFIGWIGYYFGKSTALDSPGKEES